MLSIETRLERMEGQLKNYKKIAGLLLLTLVAIVTISATSNVNRRWELQSGGMGEKSFYAIQLDHRTGVAYVMTGSLGEEITNKTGTPPLAPWRRQNGN
jgi:hypothetical protein